MYYGGGSGYVHADQHIMVFKPGSSSELLLGCDGGVFYTASANTTISGFRTKGPQLQHSSILFGRPEKSDRIKGVNWRPAG